MEEKQLEARESIELISRMIQNTRTRLERNAGRPFLIWGYTTVGISLLNYGFAITGVNSAWSLTWFLIPVIGCLLTWLFHEKRRSEPRTEIDRIVWMVWLPITLALIPIFAFCLFHGLFRRTDLYGLITLVMAIGTAITGLVVRSKIYTIAGFAGMALAMLFPLYDYCLECAISSPELAAMQQNGGINMLLSGEMVIFAMIFLVMMVIPGHIINHQNRKQCSKS
ncbi:MAG TPA: hypothetical protein H9779_02390 [Candidatus Alistipes avicola]|uniref:Uncharacterized protein n=1 Tax=Candidatus Alistipes avicola TaxID=2838432 RepID=A0A9D2IDN4_9BACT|nr:hypothetical protein [uncultured Alistipes sp.]HJA98433.1 hypothetical protein [Candidatus Alistipes avicola]